MVAVVLRAISLTGFLWVALGSPAFATQVVPISLKDISARSEVVVHGVVTDQEVRWSDDKARILTLTTLRVLETLKGGTLGPEVVIYQVGGALDGVVFRIPGAVKLQKGEEIVFFGTPYKDMLVSFGMGLGKYKVDRALGKVLVRPEFGDVAFVKKDSRGQLQNAPAPAPKGVTLSALKRVVRYGVKGAKR